jgi:hypothetical protein
MNWKNVSPGIDTAEYDGFVITRIWEKKDLYNVDHYTYVAVHNSTKFVRTDIDLICALILRNNYKQASIFD